MFSSDLANDYFVIKSCHKCCIDMVSPMHVLKFSCDLANNYFVKKSYHNCYIDMVSPKHVLTFLLIII